MKKSINHEHIGNKDCCIIRIDRISEDVDKLISRLSDKFDVYAHITIYSGINPVRYSNLIPVSGYVYGVKSHDYRLRLV